MESNNGMMKMTETLLNDVRNSVSYLFQEYFLELYKDDKRLVLELSSFRPRKEFESKYSSYQSEWDWFERIEKIRKFDLIIGDFPIGWNGNNDEHPLDIPKKIKRRNWIELFKSLSFLDESGIGLFTMEPNLFCSTEGERFESFLNDKGFFVHAVFNANDHPFKRTTTLTPIYVLIKKGKPKSLFALELIDHKQVKIGVENYINNIESDNLISGIRIDNFTGFKKIEISKQIEGLQTQFKSYQSYILADVSSQINLLPTGKEFKEIENSVYIPKIGISPVITKISEMTLKQHNYIQVVLNNNINNDYVASFFKTKIGKLIREELASGITIQNITKRNLEKAILSIPPFVEQQKIVNAQKKIESLKRKIVEFEDEMSLNPTTSASVVNHVENMLQVIGSLSEEDEIRALIRDGESKTLEFKETLCLDVRKKTKEKYITNEVLKTIVAFLNTDGGILLIGVNDHEDIIGLDEEINKFHKGSRDEILKFLKNKIKDEIGPDFYEYIDYDFVDIGAMSIIVVRCNRSNNPCYLSGKTFFVRTNPASDRLEGPELVNYVQSHFG